MAVIKEKMKEVIDAQPDDATYDEILRELAFERMVDRGLEDSRTARVISNEEMEHRIRTCGAGRDRAYRHDDRVGSWPGNSLNEEFLRCPGHSGQTNRHRSSHTRPGPGSLRTREQGSPGGVVPRRGAPVGDDLVPEIRASFGTGDAGYDASR